jgi:hypothetical protein
MSRGFDEAEFVPLSDRDNQILNNVIGILVPAYVLTKIGSAAHIEALKVVGETVGLVDMGLMVGRIARDAFFDWLARGESSP